MKNIFVSANGTFQVRTLISMAATALSLFQAGASAAQAPVALGSAAKFGVLAGSTVTTVPSTTVNGDLGIFTGNKVTGEPIVNGDLHLADPIAAQAQSDLTVAYNDAAGRTLDAITAAGNLGGLTLAPGLYKSATSLEISSGNLTLDAKGDGNAVWIFQMGSTLNTTVGRQIILSGGAKAENIFWQVGSSATIGVNSFFKGTIMADQSIDMKTGATLDGRALARVGAVTLDANTITVPVTTVPDSVLLFSSQTVDGAYTSASGQSVNRVTKTVSVPKSGGVQFYQLKSGAALVIKSIAITGANVVIAYQ